MVIDDEPKIRQLLRETLEMQEYDVFAAAGGLDALEQLKHQTVDLILLDVMMPVMDGYEVYHLLKENPKTKDIPVIIITAKGERKDRQLGIMSAPYNYVAKPFEIEELLAKVRDVLQQSVRA
jgi:DNA-binding response OmpR family regulator